MFQFIFHVVGFSGMNNVFLAEHIRFVDISIREEGQKSVQRWHLALKEWMEGQ